MSRSSEGKAGPPRVPLVFRVGIAGHRPEKLQGSEEALAGKLTSVFERISGAVRSAHEAHPHAFEKTSPRVRVVSSMAAGTDRTAAFAALKLPGFELAVPLPFAVGQAAGAEEDEELRAIDEALREVRASHADRLSVFELDGARSPPIARDDAYAAAAQVVLNQSDLLLAVWDGRPAAGNGGTAQTVLKALDARVPVLWASAVEGAPFAFLLRRS